MSGLNGWHPGEHIIHQKLGIADKVVLDYTAIEGDLPPEHAQFYETCLPFIPVTTLDEEGRPWGSILSGKDGEKGFIRNWQYTRLEVKAQTWDGDPLGENLRLFDKVERLMIAGIGVEFPTRRRNKFAGVVEKLTQSGHDIEMELLVNEAIGNCPKYINVRDLEPRMERKPNIVHNQRSLSVNDSLPNDVIEFILSCDTAFLGTSYVAAPGNEKKYPSHVGMNHRGGLPGFVRVRKDRRTVVLPDFSGNRLMTSLGNIECTPLASLTFVNFTTGDILYLTGSATNLVGSEAHDIMPFQNALTLINTTGFIFIRDALPVRQKPGTSNTASPYNPPLRLLAEESSMSLFETDNRPDATLTRITLHDAHIATFTWESSKDLTITSGQAIILDCSPFLGTREYQHMSPFNPTSVNDDHIRTWTVSSSSSSSTTSSTTRTFSITLRYKPGGTLTTAFFSIAQKLLQFRTELLYDTRPLNITVKIAGITGDFILPQPSSTARRDDLIWFAGGIGLTPFLSMLDYLRQTIKNEQINIHLILSTKEPNILLPIIFNVYNGIVFTPGLPTTLEPNENIHLTIDVFHSQNDRADNLSTIPNQVHVRQYDRRLDNTYIQSRRGDIVGKGKDVIYVCGPLDYTQVVLGGLGQLGVAADRIKTEGFFY